MAHIENTYKLLVRDLMPSFIKEFEKNQKHAGKHYLQAFTNPKDGKILFKATHLATGWKWSVEMTGLPTQWSVEEDRNQGNTEDPTPV
jgi:hypothetical protein